MSVIKLSLTEKAKAAFANKVLEYASGGDPEIQIPKILNAVDKILPSNYLVEQRAMFHEVIDNPNNNWFKLLKSLWTDIDDEVRMVTLRNFLINASLIGLTRQDASAEKYNCNVPWAMLLDPTSACNLHCTGCWAAEYGDSMHLTYEELSDIVEQGSKLGCMFYIFTGGEPLVQKKDIIKLCEEYPDCEFLSFTNGTLIDEDFANEMLRVKNFIPAISVEGFEEATDSRRGKGTYKKVIDAMKLLREKKLPFGVSSCYTHQNVESIASEEFIDYLVELGAKFMWIFTYMPVGASAPTDLLATAEDRELMYHKIREYRGSKAIFTMDFWNDGEFVGGCIAGGRRYLHINANGDIEPCAFVHYSDSNIREKSLLEALQAPLFMAYHDNQPFNDNLLRPCPILDNKDVLAKLVEQSGAHSTDLADPEDAADLCAKTHDTADKWAPVADRLWNNEHWHAGKNEGRRK